MAGILLAANRRLDDCLWCPRGEESVVRFHPIVLVCLSCFVLGSLACFNQNRPNPTRGACQQVAQTTNAEELEVLYQRFGERPLLLVGDVVYLCDCAPSRRLGGDTEERRLAGDTENRDLAGDTEDRRLAGNTEDRRLAGDTENRELAGDTEARRLDGDTEERRLAGDTEDRELAGDTEERRLAGDTEARDLDGDTENRRLAGDTEAAQCLSRPSCGSWSVLTVTPSHLFDERGLTATSQTCFP